MTTSDMALKKWKTLSSEPAFVNPWWRVMHETVELPDGSTADWWVNDQDGGVVVFALTEDRKVVVNRQYKHGVREVVTELTIGRIDGDEGGPVAEAKRELMEETGYGGGAWEELTTLISNPTSSTARLHVFLARGVRKIGDAKPDPKETIETEEVALADFVRMLEAGELATQASVAASHLALRRLGVIAFNL